GGGSHVAPDGSRIGPLSVGFRLPQEALIFGGDQLTASDIAVAAGLLDIGDRTRVAHLPAALIKAALADAHAQVEVAIDRMKMEGGDVPLLAVGGGAFLIPDRLAGVSEVLRVPHGD